VNAVGRWSVLALGLFGLPAVAQETSSSAVTAERIAKLPATQRAEWDAYLRRSREVFARDTASMNAELRATGRTAMTAATNSPDFRVTSAMTPAWFATDSARRLADIILSFQAPNGGWSKHVGYREPRSRGQSYFGESARWEWISTIDNGATTEQIRFLLRARGGRPNPRIDAALSRAFAFLAAAQYPNGCFPQVYPLQGGYHDAVTFNDDAMVQVLRAVGELPTRKSPNVPDVQRATDCILNAQVRVNGVRTGWGQQHDALTLEPVVGRSYELASISAMETSTIVDYLMSIADSSARPADVERAVDAAAAWLKSVAIHGYTYTRYELKAAPDAGPLWGRLYEIGTNRVIMANRDGLKLYDWNRLTDRRTGYGWYGDQPARTIAAYDNWKRRRT
jgi:PelA/Pel-15E family pectate lyase